MVFNSFKPGDFVLTPDYGVQRVIGIDNDLVEVDVNFLSDSVTYDYSQLKLIPKDVYTTGHSETITTEEALWQLYSELRSRTILQEGTVEFNETGQIKKLTAHFKNKD